MKNILITGCNGQLGNEMQLQAKAHPEFNFFFTDVKELDITDEQAVTSFIHDNLIDCVVNCAAYTAVDKAEADEARADMLNHVAPGFLARAVGRQGGCMVHVSTDYVFDGTAHIPYREDAATCPDTVYGHTKLAGEKAVMEECPRTAIVRTAWLYSTFGNNFVKTMLRLSGKYDAVSVVSDQKGNPTPARALAEALCVIAHEALKPDFKDYGIYHFAGNPATTWDEFARSVFKYAKLAGFIQKDMEVKSILAKDYPSKAVRPYDSRLDTNKINEVFKIALPDWQDYLPETVGEFFDEQNN